MNTKNWLTKLAATAILAATSLTAKVGPPVSIGLTSTDPLRRGEPGTIHAVLLSGTDLVYARFSVLLSTDWQILDKAPEFIGPLTAGQKLDLEFKAIPLLDHPRPLTATLTVPGYLDRTTLLDPERMGGNTPEKGYESPDIVHDPTAPVPAHRPVLKPRPPRNPTASSSPQIMHAMDSSTPLASVTGIFLYVDEQSVEHRMNSATVEVWNKNDFPLPDENCGSTQTDADGWFSIDITCHHLFSGPDVYVKIILNNDRVEVKPDALFAGDYSFQSTVMKNVHLGYLPFNIGEANFGEIMITSHVEEFQLFNLIMRSSDFYFDKVGQYKPWPWDYLPKVTVNYPAQQTVYTPGFLITAPTISVRPHIPVNEVGDVFQAYGHHLLATLGESPTPDYSNGHCDAPTQSGHCLDQPEKGAIAWTDGFPDFFAAAVYNEFYLEDNYNPTRYNFENFSIPDTFAFPGQEDHTEGVIATILWRLYDPHNYYVTGYHLHFDFKALWDVVERFDPAPSDLFHNHPTSIYEYWNGLRQFHLDQINLVSQVYVTHHISAPQPDLRITFVGNAPAQIVAGAHFQIENTVTNTGNERANSAFTVSLEFVREDPKARKSTVTLGTRQVPANLLSQISNTATTTLTVPATLTPGSYRLRVCADSTNAVPESNENNCADIPNLTEVR